MVNTDSISVISQQLVEVIHRNSYLLPVVQLNVIVYFNLLQNGMTALSYAAAHGQASVCRLLLESSADVNDLDMEMRQVFCC